MPGDLKSSTSSRTQENDEKFQRDGIKDAYACLYWMQQLVDTSTDEASTARNLELSRT
jgi:hypothetical protein